MSEHREVTIYNVYDFVNYAFNPVKGELNITWDISNADVENVMTIEKIPYDSNLKYSALWVEELKRCVGWEQGMEIQLSINYSYKPNAHGILSITVFKECYNGHIYEFIDKDGYFRVRQYKRPAVISSEGKNSREMELCNCVYNDMVDDEKVPYIFK